MTKLAIACIFSSESLAISSFVESSLLICTSIWGYGIVMPLSSKVFLTTRRNDLSFAISYDCDFEKAKSLIKDCMDKNELILQDPYYAACEIGERTLQGKTYCQSDWSDSRRYARSFNAQVCEHTDESQKYKNTLEPGYWNFSYGNFYVFSLQFFIYSFAYGFYDSAV